MNKKTTFNVILTLIMAYTLFILISTAISTSKWYNACKDFYMELKYPTPRVKIENYNDLVNSDIINKDGVKRVNLDWTLFGTTLNPLPGIPIPQGYELIVTTDNSILISDDYHSNIIPENEMIDFLLNTFLPSDAKFISHKAYFKKRHKANGTDSDVGEYLYRSDASNLYYLITFEYQYITVDNKPKLLNYYSYVTIDKKNSIE